MGGVYNMKNFLLLFFVILLFSLNIEAEEELYDVRGMSTYDRIKLMRKLKKERKVKSVNEQSQEFMSDLSKGLSGLDSARSKVFGQQHLQEIKKDAGIQEQQSAFSKLSLAMSDEKGQVENYRKMRSEKKLNGKVIHEEYLIEYKNGRTQVI